MLRQQGFALGVKVCCQRVCMRFRRAALPVSRPTCIAASAPVRAVQQTSGRGSAYTMSGKSARVRYMIVHAAQHASTTRSAHEPLLLRDMQHTSPQAPGSV